MPWDADIYRQFKTQRDAPFADLLGLIHVRKGLQVIDLGCGDGELTARLAETLPRSSVLGVDSSAAMIERAWVRAQPGLRFERTAVPAITAARGQWDLVFSYAVLQALPDHAMLIRQLAGLVAPGGQFAAVIVSDQRIPARQVLAQTAAEEPFLSALAGFQERRDVLPLERYAEILFACGAVSLTVLEKLYPLVLPDAAGLLAWYRATALLPYLDRLPDALTRPFLDRFAARLAERWPAGPVLYPAKRILIAAQFVGGSIPA